MNDKKLWKVFSEYIRLRDSNERGYCKCFTCGGIRYWRNMDAGHGIPRGHMATKFNEMNNHAQCKICNGPRAGDRTNYRKEMEKRYGPEMWTELEIEARTVCKWSQFDIDLLELAYKEKVKKLKLEKELKPADQIRA